MKAFYLIDKPIGFTSFDVLRKLKKHLNIRKMGHTGTLDPLATGALLVAVGDYTKLIPYFEKDTKEYEFTISLDGETDSFDSETDVRYISPAEQQKYKSELTQDALEGMIEENFTGDIEQVPPKYSALKINGKKALDRVRAGEEFEMKKRASTISKIEILSYEYPNLTLRATVTAGTYIRSIAHDLGEIVGTGGYITYLRRTKIGTLDIAKSQTLSEFDEDQKMLFTDLFKNKTTITLKEEVLSKINNGLTVQLEDFPYQDGEYFVGNAHDITNIVIYKKPILKAKRKI
ncbi:MAG: tRNA pseudouridine(55) synthase TruB [Candidatus Gracilibacteria bacterium]|nr:tRNA pseudouridine(55) synthase TruB [Candidatus Gracilibacteria bacterium]